jgi:hypothetical protein
VWQREAEQGLNLTAADLCRDRPELAAELVGERHWGATADERFAQRNARCLSD